jgi:hypothetical protein
MQVGFWNYYEELSRNNFMFLNPDAPIGDNVLKPVNELYACAKARGLEFMTLDMIADFKSMDAFVFFDFPNMNNHFVQKAFETSSPKYLIICESEVIKPDNWDVNNHKYFKKIFTWNDTFIDSKKYLKINYAQMLPVGINKDLSKKRKLCTLIAGRKRAKHPLELYTKRLEAIRWFEKNHPEDFDLYGISWDGYKIISRKLGRTLKRKVPFLAEYIPLRFPSYRGPIEAKRPVLEQYKFSICYENARDIPGYITEKIFDCFFAGCVPVYWGANNVMDHIPQECFIDKREFRNYEALYQYMKKISNKDYLSYLDNIESFLKSEKAYPFSSECFSKTIIEALSKQ